MTACLSGATQFARSLFGDKLPMTERQLKQFIIQLQKNAKFLLAKNDGLTESEALGQAAARMLEDAKLEAGRIRKRAYLNVIKKAEARAILKDQGFTVAAFRAYLGGGFKFRFSINNMQKAAFDRFMGGADGFYTKLRDEHLEPVYLSRDKEEDIANAMIGRDDLVVDKEAGRVGKFLRDAIELARKLQNKLGADIRKLNNFIASTTHDPMKMTSVRGVRNKLDVLAARLGRKLTHAELMDTLFERWRGFIKPLLDPITFHDTDGSIEESDKFLRGTFDGLISGIHKEFRDDPETSTESFKRGASFSRTISSKHRILIFKNDAASWLKYNREYGAGTLHNAVIHLFERASKNVGLMKMLGPDFKRTYEELRGEIGRANQLPKTASRLVGVDNVLKNLDGTTNSPVSFRGARISANIRSVIGMARLGSVVITVLSDMATRVSTVRFNGVGFLDSWAGALGDLQNIFGKESKDLRKVYDLAGTAAEQILGSIDRFSLADTGSVAGESGGITTLNKWFYKLNILRGWDHAHRQGGVAQSLRNLALNKASDWENLDPQTKFVLEQFLIDKNEWDILRKNPFKTEKGKEFITADSAVNVTKIDAARVLGKEVSELKSGDVAKVSDNLQDKMMMFTHDTADHVILHPTASDRAYVVRGLKAGTVWGEAARFMALFKMYTFGFSQRIMGRALFGARTGKGAALATAELIAGTVVLNYISEWGKAVLENRTPPDPRNMDTEEKIVFYGKMLAPGIFIFSDAIGGEYNNRRGDFLRGVGGPVLSDADDISTMMGQLFQGNIPTRQAFEFLKDNTPFANLWFLKAAMSYLVPQSVINRIDPGAAVAARKRLLRNGQTHIFNP